MISTISLLSSFLFAIIYPMCFWISYREPLQNNFHKFHLGLPVFIGGVFLVAVFFSDTPKEIKILIFGWEILFLIVSFLYWQKSSPNVFALFITSLFGLIAYALFQNHLIHTHYFSLFGVILGGIIFCSSLYAMNLGHWYLNVHGLPIHHLRWAMNVFAASLLGRLILDIAIIFSQKILYDGEMIPLWKFITHLDGFFLTIAIFFGTLFPLCSMPFAFGTLRLKNTQATTGILYVILCGVVLGDMAYKYYLVKFGISL